MAVTDNFNRANGGLGANWTTDSMLSALTIVSNAVRGGTASSHNVSVYTAGGTIAADQYAQVTVTATGAFMGPVLRSNGAGTFYVCFYQPSAAAVSIYRVIAGSYSGITSGSTVTPTVGDVVYFEAVGSQLTMKVNGVTVATWADLAITGAGYTGIDIYDNTAAAFDDFQGGAIGAVTVTVNLTGVSASPAIGVLGFNGSLPLVGVAAAPAIGTGTVALTGNVSVSLVGVAATPAIGVGTVTIAGSVVPPDQGLVTGGGRWYGLPEDEKIYLTGVAANPRVGQGILLNDAAGAYEKYSAPIRHVAAQRTPEMPPGMRRLFKPVEKPIPPAVFVYQVGLPKFKSAVGTGVVKAHYEEIDEETIAMIDLL